MIVAMSLLHKAGISSSFGEFLSWRSSVTCVRACLECWGSDMYGLLVFELGSMLLAVFLSRVMRLSCIISDSVMRGCTLVLISVVKG